MLKVYCPPRGKRGASRVERLVVQRVRRRSFLDEDFKRRGQFALGALDPETLEALEAKNAATIQRLKDQQEAKKNRGKGKIQRRTRSASPVKKECVAEQSFVLLRPVVDH